MNVHARAGRAPDDGPVVAQEVGVARLARPGGDHPIGTCAPKKQARRRIASISSPFIVGRTSSTRARVYARSAPYAEVGRKGGPTASLPRLSSFTTAFSKKPAPACDVPLTLPRLPWLNTSRRAGSFGDWRYSALTQKSDSRGW
jgi:hypothetical protein